MDKILIRGQTLWARHSWSRRQQVMPEPQRSSSQPQFPGDAVGQHMSTTLGQKHNNYLNLKNNRQNPWQGSTGTDQHGHALTTDPGHSYE
jgi:hypothetical protein